MTDLNKILATKPEWSWNENKDYLVTIGGVNFRLSEYAGAEVSGSDTRIVLKSGKELIACVGFYEFVDFIHEQIKEK